MSSSEEEADDQELKQHSLDGEPGANEKHYSADDREERDGRFYGPDSSWRHYTQNERDLAASLDQVQNDDLSIHLYNAHDWKRRHRDVDLFQTFQPWHSKRRWIRPDESGKLPFLPHSGWTAWPLRPEDVPRSRERWGIPTAALSEESGTYSKRSSWRPSLNLQDELQAVMLRKAKERFPRRQWHDVSQTSIAAKIRCKSYDSSENAGVPISPSPQKREKDDIGDEANMIKDKVQIARKPVEHYVPLFTADDEAAGMILKPTIQHIICKLDNLLLGLHKNRQAHRREPGAPRGRSAQSVSRSKSRSRKQSRPDVSNKRKRVASDAVPIEEKADTVLPSSDDDDDNDDRPGTRERSQSSTRNCALGLRDWSEILGIAALTGWNQAALDRASQRCAMTFGESMSMRFMPETSASHLEEEAFTYAPEQIPNFDMLSEDDIAEVEQKEEDSMDFNCCPFIACSRNLEPFEKRWRLREHLKRNHQLSEDDINSMENRTSAKALEDRVAPVRMETDDGNDSSDISVAEHAVVRRDGFLEPINIPLRNPKNKRRRRKSESSIDE